MASISQTNVKIGWQGQAAVNGANQLAGAMNRLASTATLVAGAMIAKGAFNALANFSESASDLGSSMQSLQIRTAYLVGSWEDAGKALTDLQDLSIKTGQSFDDLQKSYHGFITSGLSSTGSQSLVKSLVNGAELLGQGGMEAVSSAVKGLLHSATASESALASLQERGLGVYQQLGAELTRLTGKAYTTEEALRAIQRGAVSSALAIQAIEHVLNSPAVKEANARFLGSYEGQLARLKTSFKELTRDLSRSFLEAFDFSAVFAGLRGSLVAVRDIVKGISDNLLPVIDPKNNANRLEKIFESARNYTFEIARELSKSAVDLKEAFEKIVIDAEGLIKKLAYVYSHPLSLNTEDIFSVIDAEQERKYFKKSQLPNANYKQNIDSFFDNLIKKNSGSNRELIDQVFSYIPESLRGVAAASGDFVKRFEIARKTMEKFSLDLETEFASPIEKFNRGIDDIKARLIDAQNQLPQGDQLLNRVQSGLQRKAGSELQQLMREFSTGTSYQAPRAEIGSSAAVEMILRNRFGDQGKDIQQRIKNALDQANALHKANLDNQKLLLDAFNKQKPGVLIFN